MLANSDPDSGLYCFVLGLAGKCRNAPGALRALVAGSVSTGPLFCATGFDGETGDLDLAGGQLVFDSLGSGTVSPGSAIETTGTGQTSSPNTLDAKASARADTRFPFGMFGQAEAEAEQEVRFMAQDTGTLTFSGNFSFHQE